MSYLKDLHVHTKYSDGQNTIEEMIQSAISKGLTDIAITDHSYTFYDTSYCMKKEKYIEYISEVNKLKEKYKDKINILCGIEQDFHSTESTKEFDIVIGSVHYLLLGDKYVPIDEDFLLLNEIARKYCNNDIYNIIEKYFDTISNIVEKTNCDIIGHFDYISKYNKRHNLFDENNERYVNAYKKAIDKLVKYNKPFEINTAAIYKKLKDEPYPSKKIREYIKKKGGKFILNSDSHSVDTICRCFDDYENEI